MERTKETEREIKWLWSWEQSNKFVREINVSPSKSGKSDGRTDGRMDGRTDYKEECQKSTDVKAK